MAKFGQIIFGSLLLIFLSLLHFKPGKHNAIWVCTVQYTQSIRARHNYVHASIVIALFGRCLRVCCVEEAEKTKAYILLFGYSGFFYTQHNTHKCFLFLSFLPAKTTHYSAQLSSIGIKRDTNEKERKHLFSSRFLFPFFLSFFITPDSLACRARSLKV